MKPSPILSLVPPEITLPKSPNVSLHLSLVSPNTVFLRLQDGDFFSFQNNPKDLDLSCKMDLDLWNCLGRVKLVLLQNFIGLI